MFLRLFKLNYKIFYNNSIFKNENYYISLHKVI